MHLYFVSCSGEACCNGSHNRVQVVMRFASPLARKIRERLSTCIIDHLKGSTMMATWEFKLLLTES